MCFDLRKEPVGMIVDGFSCFVSKRTEIFAHIWYSMMCGGTRAKDTQYNALFRVSRY